MARVLYGVLAGIDRYGRRSRRSAVSPCCAARQSQRQDADGMRVTDSRRSTGRPEQERGPDMEQRHNGRTGRSWRKT